MIIASCVARCMMFALPLACFGIEGRGQATPHLLHGRSHRPFILQTLKDHEPDDHCKTEDAAMAALRPLQRNRHHPEIQGQNGIDGGIGHRLLSRAPMVESKKCSTFALSCGI